VANQLTSVMWAAACPRPIVLPSSGVAPASIREAVSYASVESGRVRPGGADLRVEKHVFTMLSAIQTNAQVKGAAKRTMLGPHPWRPPE
jgi:hypothetical protein